jgi:methionyl-tRNA formyltransferase
MVKNNNFYFKNLRAVLIIGYLDGLKSIIEINNELGLKTKIITSSDQSRFIDEEIDFLIFDKLDNTFESYVTKNFNIEETLFLSLSSRLIFNSYFIKNVFNNNLINFHSTRLPLDAGGGGFSWRILKEDRIDNMIFHIINEGIDTGAIIYNKKSLFPNSCKIPLDYENHRNKNFPNFYKEFISNLKSGFKFKLIHQINYLGSYNPRLNSIKNGLIDWNFSSRDLYNFINAFDDPYPGASTFLDRGNFGKLHLKKVHLHAGDGSNHAYMSGLVSRHDKDWIVVSTSDKYMLLVESVLNQDGENIISKIRPGDRFHTSAEILSAAKLSRVKYNSKG